ncbi:MAG TPA: cobaltochelatase subunit CobN [Alphaproteobacteria bacterium]|nr:cobaltochelatase subunit CobN [Alphaproteobacteria bacterium]
MHLLAATPGGIDDGTEAVDLGQTPGEIVLLSLADSELAALAAAHARLEGARPALRLANLKHLAHNLSVDLYVERVVRRARLVILRLLGGVGYWPYGVERLVAVCREESIPLALLPGDDRPDPELASLSTLPAAACHRLWRYAVEGGAENARHLLAYAATLIGRDGDWLEPLPLLRAGLYWPGLERPSLAELRAEWRDGAGVAAIVFYRALVQAADLAPIDALVTALAARGLNPLPIYVASLKDPVSAGLIDELFRAAPPAVILNATGFAAATPGGEGGETPFAAADCPVLQVVLAGGSETAWRAGMRGLSARDLAMNVALPEIDGRILARAISFKSEARFDAATQCAIIVHAPVTDRVDFTADLAANWARLRATSAAERRIAIVLANYPNRDGRLGNGVGLDTPAGTVNLLRALAASGYGLAAIPESGNALMAQLTAGPTNDLAGRAARAGGIRYALADYRAWFARLPESVRAAVSERWGAPESDPFVEGDAFRLGVLALGNAVIGVQPARGYNIDPVRSYHDAALVPPHGYLAFYAWLREGFGAHAVIHMGKHGNLEWLPGKALALSRDCFPEAAFGALPHLYPFIVNDPGEGSQAKRRAQAVIVDHLTPPLTRAESYGPLAELEQLVDEYYEAAGVDPRRLRLLAERILELSRRIGLDRDCGIVAVDGEAAALAKLDNYLCELKEMQIRDGLHVFGQSPQGGPLADLLVALTRLPRGSGRDGDASLLRALAADLGLDRGGFDPLDCVMGAPWQGSRPAILEASGVWRTTGDTVERLERLARDLVAGECDAALEWQRSRAVLDAIETTIRPAVAASGAREIAGVLAGLDGRFVAPGPSGAPTRGRLDVLPTGRNFYSLDSRIVPTPAAWQLGWQSACLLLERHRQEHGAWPKALALSAWGTANMRTGGDDIAQALALMGVRPTWDAASRRVTGFEILPLAVLDRPRVDVTLRVSGFFRDAFPAQIDLVDSAARAVAALDEPPEMNPLAARVAEDAQALIAAGVDEATARRRAGHRVFGSKPGAYGAGLQALIDERCWRDEGDLARAYLAWGGYAYGGGSEGRPEHRLFERRLAKVEAVLHNQDNREHDLLDSDDYYQFEGGMTAAVRHLAGRQPAVYHNDHSRPERPRIRSLAEEIARVVRARVVNPKWIAGAMRHGYKGAFEMAATVDYLFAFAATTHAVADHHFDAVYDAYLGDAAVYEFLRDNNPAAAREIAARLIEAQERGLWRPRSNSAYPQLAALAAAGHPEMRT